MIPHIAGQSFDSQFSQLSIMSRFRTCVILFQEEPSSKQLLAQNGIQNDDPETKCGFCNFQPDWLQKLASKKSYVIAYGILGMFQIAIGSYFISSISTLEKRFKIPSKTSGIIASLKKKN